MSSWMRSTLLCLLFGSFAFAQSPSAPSIGPAPAPTPTGRLAPAPSPPPTSGPLTPSAVPVPTLPSAAESTAPKKAETVVAYFSMAPKTQFENKIKPIFDKQTASCRACRIVDYTPYNDKGEFVPEKLESAIKGVPADVKILFFDFNLKRGSFSEALMAALNQQASNGPMVVASAGAPLPQEPSRPLSKTVFGQVRDALIIGDLEERDRLAPQSFFGPEMYTAIRPPKDLQGRGGVGTVLFVSKLANQFQRRSVRDWLAFLKTKKERNRKIWLELGDLFY